MGGQRRGEAALISALASVGDVSEPAAPIVDRAAVEPEQPPVATVTVMVPVVAEPAADPLPEAVSQVLPIAAAQPAPELPVADATPVVPFAAGG